MIAIRTSVRRLILTALQPVIKHNATDIWRSTFVFKKQPLCFRVLKWIAVLSALWCVWIHLLCLWSFLESVTKRLLLHVPLNHVHFSRLGVGVTLHITTPSGSSALRLKWPPSLNKDASLLKAPHSTVNLVPPCLPTPLLLQSVLPAPTVCLWKRSVPKRWAEPLHVYIGPRGIPACPLLLLSFVSQMDTN